MKSKLCISFLSLSSVILIVFFACRKSNTRNSNTDPSSPGDTTVRTNAISCDPPNYGDSIVFLKYKGVNHYTVSPLNDTLPGKWFSWPEGLVIDSTTGTIDLTQSETGERFNIGYVKNGTHDTCVSQLIVGGITYLDSVYILEHNDTLAMPIYNANPNTPPVCDNSNGSDYPPGVGNSNGQGNNKCQFDVDPPKGQANGNGLRVRTISGIIDLKKTVTDGIAFGSSTPANGATKTITVQYRLNDNSGKALQRIAVQLVYYNKVSDIPASLKAEVATKRNNFFNYRVVNGRPRPPLIIITPLAQ